jgi:hypothetical protein
VEEIDLDDIVTLRGFDTAIKSGEAKIDECFPPVTSPATALPSGRVRVTNLPKEEPASEPPTDEHGEIKDGPASAETLNRIQAQLVELNQPAPSYRKLHGIKSFADLTQSQAEQHVAMLDDQILVRSKKPARDTAALPGVPEPEDSTLLERADAILRIREALKEKSLTEKAACGWVKPPLAKLEDATAEQLQAIEAELAKRT